MAELAHAALLLAAGASRRLGQPKQLVQIAGVPLIRHLALEALASEPSELLVTLGAEADRCRDALCGLPLRCLVVPDWASGMGASLAAGAGAAAPGGLLVLGVDQPALRADHLRQLLSRWRVDPGHPVASGYAGIAGVPAVFPAAWRASLASLNGDQGARRLLRDCRECQVVDAPELAFDLDQPDDLVRWLEGPERARTA